eukprot:Nk52_evm8s236 gene=Nk52_evmTU8s236
MNMNGTSSSLKKKSNKPPQIVTPWTRIVQNGIDILRNPKYNKGLAFTKQEREFLRIDGLLPPTVITQDEQVTRVMWNLRRMDNALQKYIYVIGLQNRNEKLFYRVLHDHIEELMPIVYTPTVGQACQEYGNIFRSPRGLFISLNDRGNIFGILKNWPEKHVKAIVVTDGERILGLGDLGAYGMGIPVGKLTLYTACAGFKPNECLPVTIDVGTDNKDLLESPFYIGLRQRRDRSQAYDDLIEEFVFAVKKRFGNNTLIQWEDFGNTNAFKLLHKYEKSACSFNDDIQGTASVTVAGIFSFLKKTDTKMGDNTFLFYGAGEAALGIADLIVSAMVEEGLSEEEARDRVWLVDSRGLVVKDRPKGGLTAHKLVYAHEHKPLEALEDIVKSVKPHAIIGVSAQPGTFTKEVIEAMARNHEHPLIFSLSNPTSKSECTAEAAYKYTKGKCYFASGSPFSPVKYGNKTFLPGQGNNAYIFPGVALGVVVGKFSYIPNDVFLLAARTLADLVPKEYSDQGCLYPPLTSIRDVSEKIAAAVVQYGIDNGISHLFPLPAPKDIHHLIERQTYSTDYGHFVANDEDMLMNSSYME